MLCGLCLRLVSALIDKQECGESSFLPIQRLRDLVGSFESTGNAKECYLCGQLERPIEEFEISFSPEVRSSKRSVFAFHLAGSGEREVFWVQPAHIESHRVAEQACLSNFTGSTASFDLASYWLQNCLQNHSRCKTTTQGWYPTRLLDLSSSLVRLIKTSTEKPQGPYATMSHCWGRQKFVVLTAENLCQFEHGIEVRQFPPNFRDAITVTKRLGLQYLWIDCFCIIQESDSSEHRHEKMSEISQMKSVYANSILNIGASHASDPTIGCFITKERDISMPECFFPRRREDTLSKEKGPMYHLYHGQKADISVASLNGCPIFERGWVLQERMLCPRMLHFGADQLYWECRELLPASEDFPTGQVPAAEQRVFSVSIDLDDSNAALTEWCRIITDYSGMKLTLASEDKFLAISGIAEVVAMQAKDEYVAGFLRSRLILQLCWYSLEISRNADDWRAPSWSWAAIDGVVRFRTETFCDLHRLWMASINDTHVKLADSRNSYVSLFNVQAPKCP